MRPIQGLQRFLPAEACRKPPCRAQFRKLVRRRGVAEAACRAPCARNYIFCPAKGRGFVLAFAHSVPSKSLSSAVARVNTAGRSDCCPGRPGGKFVESGGLLSFRPALYSWGGVTIHPKAWNCSVPNDLADYL